MNRTALINAETRTALWSVRYLWQVPEGSTHPSETTVKAWTESGAIDSAVSLMDDQDPTAALRIIRVDVCGPDGCWNPVDWRP
jgi:hypothetical protein